MNAQEQKALKNVISTLAEGQVLDKSYKDHKLTGNYLGCRECHVKPDLLLIYRIDNNILELALVRTGTHSKLFK